MAIRRFRLEAARFEDADFATAVFDTGDYDMLANLQLPARCPFCIDPGQPCTVCRGTGWYTPGTPIGFPDET